MRVFTKEQLKKGIALLNFQEANGHKQKKKKGGGGNKSEKVHWKSLWFLIPPSVPLSYVQKERKIHMVVQGTPLFYREQCSKCTSTTNAR